MEGVRRQLHCPKTRAEETGAVSMTSSAKRDQGTSPGAVPITANNRSVFPGRPTAVTRTSVAAATTAQERRRIPARAGVDNDGKPITFSFPKSLSTINPPPAGAGPRAAAGNNNARRGNGSQNERTRPSFSSSSSTSTSRPRGFVNNRNPVPNKYSKALRPSPAPSPSPSPILRSYSLPIQWSVPQTGAEALGNDPYLYSSWSRGPADPSGAVLNLSDRPLLCMSVRGTEAAIGCSDHGVYVVDVAKRKLRRNLYGKRDGHVDWVTCVDILPDGRIVSGGMDNVLCVWDATAVRCTVLGGHTASISGLKLIDGRYGISASYDKTLLLWDWDASMVKSPGKPVGCLRGHRGAVLEFALNGEGGIVSGSRDGEVFLWDGREGKAVLKCRGAHDGHVTAVTCLRDAVDTTDFADAGVAGEIGKTPAGDQQGMFLTGGHDGFLRVWDMRTKAPIHAVPISRSAKGKGAVTSIATASPSPGGRPLVVTASADNIIQVLEPRSSFRPLYIINDHTDFIYSLHVCGPLIWSGASNGNLLLHDLKTGGCLYGLGATDNGAPRCISLVGPRSLVVAGDDGNCMIYWV